MPKAKTDVIGAYCTEIHVEGIKAVIACGSPAKLEKVVRILTGITGYDETLVDHIVIARAKEQPHRKPKAAPSCRC
jgi:hypothetical protein